MSNQIELEQVDTATGEVVGPQDKIIPAMVKAWGEIGLVYRDSIGKDRAYTYASIASIFKMIHEVMSKHDLAFFMQPYVEPAVIRFKATLYHSSGQVMKFDEGMAMRVEDGKFLTSQQSIGSAITYGQRYYIASLFAIATEEDTDGAPPQPKGNRGPAPKTANNKLKNNLPSVRDALGEERAAKMEAVLANKGLDLNELRVHLKTQKNMDPVEIDAAVKEWPDRWSPIIKKWMDAQDQPKGEKDGE